VRAGRGSDVKHKDSGPGHRYQSLGSMRAPHNTLETLLITLTERADAFALYQHAGTQLIYMISGRMEYLYDNSRYLLEPGDAMQFVGEVPHGPTSLVELPIQFISVKSTQPDELTAGAMTSCRRVHRRHASARGDRPTGL
jgi:hypothetical protein